MYLCTYYYNVICDLNDTFSRTAAPAKAIVHGKQIYIYITVYSNNDNTNAREWYIIYYVGMQYYSYIGIVYYDYYMETVR